MSNQLIFDVILYIWGDMISPTYITDALGIEPTFTQSKGDKRTLSSGEKAVAKKGLWQLSTKGLVNSECVTDHVVFIIDKISNREGKITDIEGVEGAHFYIGIFRDFESKRGVEFDIDPTLLKESYRLGIGFRFVYD